MKIPVKKNATRTTNANSFESPVDLQEQISRRAYELYEQRGRDDGHETEDWLAGGSGASERKNPVA